MGLVDFSRTSVTVPRCGGPCPRGVVATGVAQVVNEVQRERPRPAVSGPIDQETSRRTASAIALVARAVADELSYVDATRHARHHEHHHHAAGAPHEHHGMRAPLPFPGAILGECAYGREDAHR